MPEWSSSKNNKDRGNRALFIPPATSPFAWPFLSSCTFLAYGQIQGLFFFSSFFSLSGKGGRSCGGTCAGKAPCPSLSSSPQDTPRRRCSAGAGREGAVPSTPCQAEPSPTGTQLRAEGAGEKPLPPSQQAARSARLRVRRPHTQLRDSLRRSPQTSRSRGWETTGAGGPSLADMIYGDR